MRTAPGPDHGDQLSMAARARRGQIIRAAAEVVAEVGYANASTARIAGRAGISKGVITYHFASKDEILRSVALRLFERCADEVSARMAAATTAAEQVHAWVRAEMEFFAAHRIEFLAMSDIMANHRDPDFFRAFDDEVTAETRRLADILRRGQRQEEFRPFDDETVAHVILRCRDGVLARWTDDPDDDLSAQIDTLLDFIDRAISADRVQPGAVVGARQ